MSQAEKGSAAVTPPEGWKSGFLRTCKHCFPKI